MALWEFLGMTREEYGRWVVEPETLPTILLAHRGRPFEPRATRIVRA
jgi:hypothetical protein